MREIIENSISRGILKKIVFSQSRDPAVRRAEAERLFAVAKGYEGQIKEISGTIADLEQRQEELKIASDRNSSARFSSLLRNQAAQTTESTASRDLEKSIADRKAEEERRREAEERAARRKAEADRLNAGIEANNERGEELQRKYQEVRETYAPKLAAARERAQVERQSAANAARAFGAFRREGTDSTVGGYDKVVAAHHRPYWKRGIAVDVIDGDSPLDGYSLVVAPCLFMLRDGFAERVESFVEAGGTFMATWLTGIVGPTGLCFQGGFPGPLRKTRGVWAEEIDYLYDDERNSIAFADGNALGVSGSFQTSLVCDVIHAEGADVVATYGRDFYAGAPVVTVNRFGKGEAWYLATRGDDAFLDAFHGAIASRLALPRAIDAELPEGVTANLREGENGECFVFLTNFASESRTVDLGTARYRDLLANGAEVSGATTLPPFGVMALR